MAKKSGSIFALLGTASVMGLHMVSGPIVGAGLGYFFDKYFETSPYGFVIGLVLGVLAGYRNVMKDSKTLQKEQERYQQSLLENEEIETNPHEYTEFNLFGDPKVIKLDKENKSEEKTSNE